jgi:hypothetical protein
MKNFLSGLPSAVFAVSVAAVTAVSLATTAAAGDEQQPFLPDIAISSTIPANGDLNPYGVAIVPQGFPAGQVPAPRRAPQQMHQFAPPEACKTL